MTTDAIGNRNGPKEQAKRFEWLFEVFDKHSERFDKDFTSLNQKATWTLATATGLAAASGFVKGTAVGVSVRRVITEIGAILEQTSNVNVSSFAIDIVIVIAAVAFATCYLRLLHFVLLVYGPKSVEYPVSPINTDLGPVKSRHDDEGKFGAECWKDVKGRYIDTDDTDRHHKVLRGYIDTFIETYLTIDKMGKNLQNAFRLLYPIAGLSVFLLLLA